MAKPHEIYSERQGRVPLLVSIPHSGGDIPDAIAAYLTPAALRLPDTDWHLDRLYDFVDELELHVIQARFSRYVIDLNRAPDDALLYAGASNTELVPTTTFAEDSIYLDGYLPGGREIVDRREVYWKPYHDRLASILKALRDRHGRAILFDCHSIRSEVPRFFAGTLPDFNLGTADGASCAPELRDRLAKALAKDRDFTLAVDGRFKGGYITRHYGNPASGIHAFQMELSQATYMDEDPPYSFREKQAGRVRPTLRRMLEAALDWIGA